jgi:hypothetical protein
MQQKHSFHHLTHQRRFISAEPLKRTIVKVSKHSAKLREGRTQPMTDRG